MGQEFEDQDLSESVFWGVRLNDTMFRDADLSGSRFFHTLWSGVEVDGVIDRLVVNGVDVTDYVNTHDRWFPLRTMLEPATGDAVRAASAILAAEWNTLLERVAAADPSLALESVNGEWSVRDTLRHLVFAMDKWFAGPLLGRRGFTPIGLPNSGSQGRAWPGIDLTLDPTMEAALESWRAHWSEWEAFIAALDTGALPANVEVEENGDVPGIMCLHVVLEETFEHLRYALRDLDTLLTLADSDPHPAR